MPSPRLSVSEMMEGIRAGDISRLGRAITLMESSLASDQTLAAELLDACMPFAGGAYRIGITGAPGVGKSTFIEHWGLKLAQSGHRIAVLTIDPSSQRTGGSILGDKTRMNELSAHPNVFVRPSPAGRALGGVNWRTREAILVCEAAGFDIILVETVGVGQSETLVHGMVDFFLLLLLPGGGDSLQGIKRGIMELADGVLVTKADTAEGIAKRTVQEYAAAIRLIASHPPNGWVPFVQACSSLSGLNLEEVWNKLLTYRQQLTENNHWMLRRIEQQLAWFRQLVDQQLHQHFYTQPNVAAMLPKIEAELRSGVLSPPSAVQRLFRRS